MSTTHTASPLLPSHQKVIRLAHRPIDHIDPPSHYLPLSIEPVPTFPPPKNENTVSSSTSTSSTTSTSKSSSTTTAALPPSSIKRKKDANLILLHRLYLSLDPAMRGWMSSAKSYLPPVSIGGVMRGMTLSEVIAIQHERSDECRGGDGGRKRLKVGDIVSEFTNTEGGWQEYTIASETSVRKVETTFEELIGSNEFSRILPTIPTIPTEPKLDLPLTAHLSILGMTGLTAYFGFCDVGSPRCPPSSHSSPLLLANASRPHAKLAKLTKLTKSTSNQPNTPETVLVTAAAGAVGSVVCQIAKFVYGCKVIGVAGGPKKCTWLKEDLKCCDAVIDYRAMEREVDAKWGKGGKGGEAHVQKAAEFQTLLRQCLKQIGSRGFDIVFDNVGGYQLNESISRLNFHARVVLCGAISGYNVNMAQTAPTSSSRQPPNNPNNSRQMQQTISPTALYMKNGMALISLRAKIQGFIVLDYIRQWHDAKRDLARWMLEGRIRYQKEDVREGLENAPNALVDLFHGRNTGKLIVKVGDRLTGNENSDARLKLAGRQHALQSKL